MERDGGVLPPNENKFDITIAGERFNIAELLEERPPIYIYENKAKPGDVNAQDLLRTFTNICVTPTEYRTAMPNLFHLAAKEEGGFDEDLLDVTRFIMGRTMVERGVHVATYMSDSERIAYFSEVYGQVKAFKNFVCRFPELADHKNKIAEKARKYLNERGGLVGIFPNQSNYSTTVSFKTSLILSSRSCFSRLNVSISCSVTASDPVIRERLSCKTLRSVSNSESFL